MNPYFGTDFFQFFSLWIQRMMALCTGQLPLSALASDEIQIFVLGLVAISSALTGTLLTLKKMTMLANSLSHTLLLGIVVAYLLLIPFLPSTEAHSFHISLKVLFLASLVTALLTTTLTRLLTRLLRVQEDASIGLVFNTLFALGIVLVTVFTRNAHLGTEAIMGNVDALHLNDLSIVWPIALLNAVIVTLLYKEFKMTLFDPSFGNSQGFSTHLLNDLLMVLTAATVISAFRAVGVLLVLSFLVAPALLARLFTHTLKGMLLFSILIGTLFSLFSVALARHLLSVHQFPISTAGLVVSLLGVGYGLAVLLKRVTSLKKPGYPP
jgi:manganese/zinc/iron transport system permease protein